MSVQLHLLRPFTGWPIGSHTTAHARAYVEHLSPDGEGEFYTWTRRMPRRTDELAGGSVYFVGGKETLFRMPFLLVDPGRMGIHIIVMEPRVIPVESHRVGFLRGWRYLKDADAPTDRPPAARDGTLPPELRAALEALGL